MGSVIVDSSGQPLRTDDGVLIFNPYRTFYVHHDWQIDLWQDSYRAETPIRLYARGDVVGYGPANQVTGWQDAAGGIYQPLLYCRYRLNIWLHLAAGDLTWKGTFYAFQNRSETGTISANIQKSDAGFANPLGVWEVTSSSSSGTGITMGTSIEVTE